MQSKILVWQLAGEIKRAALIVTDSEAFTNLLILLSLDLGTEARVLSPDSDLPKDLLASITAQLEEVLRPR